MGEIESKYIKVVASFYFRLGTEEIDVSILNIPYVQEKINQHEGIEFDPSDGGYCVVEQVELL